jgi:hypothetical protein
MENANVEIQKKERTPIAQRWWFKALNLITTVISMVKTNKNSALGKKGNGGKIF